MKDISEYIVDFIIDGFCTYILLEEERINPGMIDSLDVDDKLEFIKDIYGDNNSDLEQLLSDYIKYDAYDYVVYENDFYWKKEFNIRHIEEYLNGKREFLAAEKYIRKYFRMY